MTLRPVSEVSEEAFGGMAGKEYTYHLRRKLRQIHNRPLKKSSLYGVK